MTGPLLTGGGLEVPTFLVLRDPPLDPSGDDARSDLRRELAKPEYYDRNVLDRIVGWIQGLFDDTVAAASGAPPVSVAVTILVALALITAIMLVVSRARRTARAERSGAPALADEAISADALRARAEQALAAGDAAAALIDAFRATAVRQVERDRIDDVPQATALELARALAAAFPDHAAEIHRGAGLFDEVLYGDHPATVDQARSLLSLDDALGGRAVRR
ncbi:DUF4129 domain-containing protein [Nocardioides caeni]|uniref:DUF4129 domain-containing protein n=1 Tax=Nocardioides caeni TaxID=574700 RepID=A0A4S8NAF6_9ACTN|nr:DUF4129 domain-containing protein [Nocardioides caeni]THV12069.1 DUF4129 domain-containing protein [Nocardioides caeni]